MSLARLTAAASQLTPALVHSNSSQWDCGLDMQSEPQQTLAELHQRIKQKYPTTPPLYWGVQCWRQVSWQPVYLAVAAVHGTACVPQLNRVTQRLQDTSLYHYDVKASDWRSGSLPSLIESAAAQLVQLSEQWRDAILSVGKLGGKNAKYLLADALSHCLALLRQQDAKPEEIVAYNQDWLAALGLSHCSGVQLTDIGDGLAIRRNGCCLNYLLSNESPCANCPRNCRR